MKHSYFFLIAFFLVNSNLFSQNKEAALWTPVSEASIRLTGPRQITPQKFTTFSLNSAGFKDKLFQAPHEKNMQVAQSPVIISIPSPDGAIQRFRVVESPIMAEALAAAFPDMKTFIAKGIDDPHATARFDWNEFGFHAIVNGANGDFFIDPYCVGNINDYQSYYTADFVKPLEHRISEGTPIDIHGDDQKKPAGSDEHETGYKSSSPPAVCVGAQLRTYRMAVACTGEYAKAATGLSSPTVPQTLAKIVTSVNRVNYVYEREVSVRLVLVASETVVVFTDPATDPFTGNFNGGTLIGESQTVITNLVGSSNFDIGHTFSTGGGGLASLGVVCVNSGKASGITGSNYPVGDPYDIDYVAHEVGHQFRGNHTFNSITGNCNGNRAPTTSVEPGSGITIMAYAGLCPSNNLANNSIPYFHAISYDEIVNFVTTGAGNSCPVISNTGNNAPIVTVAGSSYLIPKSTPFVLTGSATDPDGDKVYYSWEETDAGTAAGNWNSGNKPFFRSYAPDSVVTPGTPYSRYFPRKNVVSTGNFTATLGEFLPKSAQVLNFRLTARDKKPGGGGVCYATTIVTVDDSGPLTVTYPNAAGIWWLINSPQTLEWDVNGTDAAPVNCDSVRISISYDSGGTYTVLINSTPNDGWENIIAPNLPATIGTCRIKVECADNIFYDISNTNFTITTVPIINTVGISQVSEVNPVALNVWPNPFSSQVNFTVGNLNSKSKTMVSVVDMLGKTVLQYTYSNKTELKETLDLSSLSEGVYFVKVSNDNNQSVHRIIKE